MNSPKGISPSSILLVRFRVGLPSSGSISPYTCEAGISATETKLTIAGSPLRPSTNFSSSLMTLVLYFWDGLGCLGDSIYLSIFKNWSCYRSLAVILSISTSKLTLTTFSFFIFCVFLFIFSSDSYLTLG